MKSEFDFRTLRKQPVNYEQIELIFQKAKQTLRSSEKILPEDSESAFTLAYESMLKASLALMHSRGFRPRIQLGHHKIIVNYASYVLGDRFSEVTATYDRMRSKRNKAIYDVYNVSQTEAQQAFKLANEYLSIVASKIEEENPQLKLF